MGKVIFVLFEFIIIGFAGGWFFRGWSDKRNKPWYEHKVYYSVDIDGYEATKEDIEEFITRKLEQGVGKIELK